MGSTWSYQYYTTCDTTLFGKVDLVTRRCRAYQIELPKKEKQWPQRGVVILEPPPTVQLEHVENDRLGIEKYEYW